MNKLHVNLLKKLFQQQKMKFFKKKLDSIKNKTKINNKKIIKMTKKKKKRKKKNKIILYQKKMNMWIL